MSDGHVFGGSDRLILEYLRANGPATDARGAWQTGLSETTYRIQRWRLSRSGLVYRAGHLGRAVLWGAVTPVEKPLEE
jgi:hypothetical protein